MDATSSDAVDGTPTGDPNAAYNAVDIDSIDWQANIFVERCPQPGLSEDVSTPATAAEAVSFQMSGDKRRIVRKSLLYPGETFTFIYSKDGVNRDYYVCNACSRLCHTYRKCLEPCGIKRQNLKMENGRFVNDPDRVGTNKGHLCMQPALEAQLRAMLPLVAGVRKKAASSAKGNTFAETLEQEYDESNTTPQTNAVTTATPSRKRSAALLSRRSGRTNDDDGERSFGLVKFVALPGLTDRQRRLIEELPATLRHAMRGKEAVQWFDDERKVTFRFLLVDVSNLVDGAWEYYCAGCYSVRKDKRRVIVRGNRFLRFDPRRPEDQEHVCFASRQTARKPSSGMPAQKSAPGRANMPATKSAVTRDYGNVIRKSNGHVEYRSRLYDDHHIDFSRSTRKQGTKQWFPCTDCFGLRTTCKEKLPGCISAKLFSAIVRNGRFIDRDPDVCGLQLEFANGKPRCVHVCLDAELQQLISGTSEPPRKQMRLSRFFDTPRSTPGADNTLPIRSTTQPPGSIGSPHVDRQTERASNGRAETTAASLTSSQQNLDIVPAQRSYAIAAAKMNAVLVRDSIPTASSEEIQYVTTTVKKEPAKTRSRFVAFVEAEGLKEEFAEFDLEHGRSYATKEKSHVAFLKQRGLLGKYTDSMS